MATIDPHPATPPDDAGPRLMRVPERPRAQRSALAVLLTGRDHPRDPAVDHFVGFLDRQGLPLTGLWGAYPRTDYDAPNAAALILANAGGAAMLFLSPIADRGGIAPAQRLVHAALAGEDPDRQRLIQCLLEPGDHHAHAALAGVGFEPLARLVYMQRGLTGRDRPHAPRDLAAEGYRLLPWSEDRRPLFAQAILESYENTQDCPGLLGMRSIDQIIASHMATGEFDPQRWTLCLEGDTPVAIMLLSGVPAQDAAELVYLGVSQRARGAGLGGALLSQGLWQAACDGAARMLLAVDEANPPALKLYRHLGFRATTRKSALIRPPQGAISSAST